MILKSKFSNYIKLDLSIIAFIGLIIQIFSTQGILTYNFFKLLGLWQLKMFLHPIGVMLVLGSFLIKVIKNEQKSVKTETFLLFYYLFFQYIFIITLGKFSLSSFYYSFREVVLILLLIAIYPFFNFNLKQFELITKILFCLVVLNILFIFLNFYLGVEKYMLLMTGRFYWTTDPLLNFKISTFLGILPRSPGLIGESAAVGFFGVFSFFFIRNSKLKKYIWLPLLLVFLSLTRSAYLVIFLFFIFKIFSKRKNFKKFIYFSPTILVFFFFLEKLNLLSAKSLWMRVDNWLNKVKLESNLFLGGNLNNIGTAAPIGSGFAATMDSYWLLVFHGIGILGICLVIYFLVKKVGYKKNKLFFLIAISTAGIFVTLTQSIPFLVFFPLLSIKKWWVEDDELLEDNLKLLNEK